MNASEQVLALYRAARDFTRRVVGVEALERAALDYAASRGWVPAAEAHDIGIEHAKLSEGIDRAYQTRIDALEKALREVVGVLEYELECGGLLPLDPRHLPILRALVPR